MTADRSDESRLLRPILAINFVGTLGFSLVLPFLVFLVTRWGGNGVVFGIIGATYSAFQLVGAPLLGRWSDLYGRRRILLFSQLGTLLSWLVFLVAFALPVTPLAEVRSPVLGTFTITLPLLVVFVARACDGITGGNVSVANAYLADVTTEETRSAAFGRMAVAANLGFILGPAIAGILGATALGELLPVAAAAAIALIATLIVYWGLPESTPCILTRDPESVSVRKVFGQEQKECFDLAPHDRLGLIGALRMEGVGLLLAIYFLVMLGFHFFYVAFPMHAVEGLRWSVISTGVFFSVMGLLMVLVQGPILSRLSRRMSDEALAFGGSLILAVGFALFRLPNDTAVYGGVALLALGNGLMWPSVLSILSKTAGPAHQGAVQGVAGSVGAGASILGLLAGGLLYELVGPVVFLVAAVVVLVAFGLTARLLPPRRALAPA